MSYTVEEAKEWKCPQTREELETALDSGNLFAAMNNGKLWALRRNGRTKTWKTRPNEFVIPVKYGLRGYAVVAEYSLLMDYLKIRP